MKILNVQLLEREKERERERERERENVFNVNRIKL